MPGFGEAWQVKHAFVSLDSVCRQKHFLRFHPSNLSEWKRSAIRSYLFGVTQPWVSTRISGADTEFDLWKFFAAF
jgi:hypothetical protein